VNTGGCSTIHSSSRVSAVRASVNARIAAKVVSYGSAPRSMMAGLSMTTQWYGSGADRRVAHYRSLSGCPGRFRRLPVRTGRTGASPCAHISEDRRASVGEMAFPRVWAYRCDPVVVAFSTQCAGAPPERVSNDVDLLVTQAMIAINQSVFKHQRQFSLDRLKISAAGMFPVPSRTRRDPCPDDAFDVAVPGREARRVSPVPMPAVATYLLQYLVRSTLGDNSCSSRQE